MDVLRKKQTVPVSVIIPCYRCHTTIGRALTSVVDQTVLPAEIICVEDYSNDDGKTIAELARLQERFGGSIDNLAVIRLNVNKGPAAARNTAWDSATQPYIAFLDADDSWHPRKLEIQYSWMKEHPDIVLTAHASVHLKSGGRPSGVPHIAESKPIHAFVMLISNRIATRSVMMRKDVACRFAEEKKYAEDYHLWLRIILRGNKAEFLQAPLCYTYKTDYLGSGLSSRLWQMEKGELDVYGRLVKEGLLSPWVVIILYVVSLSKYFRRTLVRFVRDPRFTEKRQ